MIADDITAWGLVPRDRTSARVAVAMFRAGRSMNDHSLGALIRTALAVGCLDVFRKLGGFDRRRLQDDRLAVYHRV